MEHIHSTCRVLATYTCNIFLQHTGKNYIHKCIYVFLLNHTCNSCSVLCYLPHNCPPHIEENIHSVCTVARLGRHRWFLCVCGKAALLCVRSLCWASPHFSPLFSRGKSSERHRFKAHTASYAFPCQQSDLTHSLTSLAKDLDSHRFSSPLDLSNFVGLHRSRHLPFLSVDVYTSSMIKYGEALYLQSLLWVIYSHFPHTLNRLSHLQKFSDMINVYINFKDVSSLLK